MNYYFLPQIEGLRSVLTISNFPCIQEKHPWYLNQFIYAAWDDSSSWQVRRLKSISAGQSLEICFENLPGDFPKEATPFFFLYPKELPEILDRLIVSDLMNTEPNWRSNIRISSPTTSTSYQGEYPGEMIQIKKGSLLSFGPLSQVGPGLATKFIFSNLKAEPGSASGKIRFAQMNKKKILLETEVHQNRCTVIDISDLDIDESSPLCAISDDLTGIPVYLTHDADCKKMSLEHTHAPMEILTFGDRRIFQRNMKSWWSENTK
ncbi:MAG: hypothetical protein VW455_00905 [Nitrospinota bacterium]